VVFLCVVVCFFFVFVGWGGCVVVWGVVGGGWGGRGGEEGAASFEVRLFVGFATFPPGSAGKRRFLPLTTTGACNSERVPRRTLGEGGRRRHAPRCRPHQGSAARPACRLGAAREGRVARRARLAASAAAARSRRGRRCQRLGATPACIAYVHHMGKEGGSACAQLEAALLDCAPSGCRMWRAVRSSCVLVHGGWVLQFTMRSPVHRVRLGGLLVPACTL